VKFQNPINLLNKSTAPSSPAAGDVYYDSAGSVIAFYDGSQWNSVNPRTYMLQAYQALGGSVIAEPPAGSFMETSGTAVTIASQALRFIPIWLPRAATITGVKFGQIIQGAYTSNNYNGVGLYTYSAGTLTRVASSADDGTIWKTGNVTIGSKAFSSTYAASPGLLFVAMLYCSSAQTTAPTLAAFPPGQSTWEAFDFTNSAKMYSTLASQTSLPSTQAMSGLSNASGRPYFGLY
jgi:hypothetical protein